MNPVTAAHHIGCTAIGAEAAILRASAEALELRAARLQSRSDEIRRGAMLRARATAGELRLLTPGWHESDGDQGIAHGGSQCGTHGSVRDLRTLPQLESEGDVPVESEGYAPVATDCHPLQEQRAESVSTDGQPSSRGHVVLLAKQQELIRRVDSLQRRYPPAGLPPSASSPPAVPSMGDSKSLSTHRFHTALAPRTLLGRQERIRRAQGFEGSACRRLDLLEIM